MPSGSLRPSLTIVFKSEPSGFMESTRPPPRSRRNRRAEVALDPRAVCFGAEKVDGMEITAILYVCFSLSENLSNSRRLHESAEPRDGLAHNERVHLPGTLIGVDGLGIGDEAANLVVQQNAVGSKQLAREAYGLAHLDRTECLCQRCVFVLQFALVLKLRQTHNHA